VELDDGDGRAEFDGVGFSEPGGAALRGAPV